MHGLNVNDGFKGGREAESPRPSTIGAVFDPRRNALNAIRLTLALLVIVWHSFPLTGAEIYFEPLRQVLASISVDGFFAISGFLIVQSWLRMPDWKIFLSARTLRIMPAFWVSLIVTAAVIAPVGTLINQGRLPSGFATDAVGYVLKNSALWVFEYGIAGTPSSVPFPGAWNGSMWTLAWEFLCYLGVLALGLSTLLRRSWVIPALFMGTSVGVLATSYGPIENVYVVNASRFGIMFAAGAIVYQFRNRMPANPRYLALAAILTIASAWLPDYRIIAALPVAYLMIALGSYGKADRLQFRHDLSYGTYIFAFPLAQLLASVGAWKLGVPVFAVLSIAITMPVAAASWFWVEKPALRLKRKSPSNTARKLVAERVDLGPFPDERVEVSSVDGVSGG